MGWDVASEDKPPSRDQRPWLHSRFTSALQYHQVHPNFDPFMLHNHGPNLLVLKQTPSSFLMLPLTQDGASCPCPASDEALLAGALSTFLRLAKFYTGDSLIARTARDALGPRDAFYTNLQIELEALSKHIGRQNNETSIGDNAVDALASVLSTLESSLRAEKLTLDVRSLLLFCHMRSICIGHRLIE